MRRLKGASKTPGGKTCLEAESGLRLGRIKKSPVCDRSRILIGNECVSCFCHQNSPKTRRFQPFPMAFTRAKRAEMEVFQGQTSENEASGATRYMVGFTCLLHSPHWQWRCCWCSWQSPGSYGLGNGQVQVLQWPQTGYKRQGRSVLTKISHMSRPVMDA